MFAHRHIGRAHARSNPAHGISHNETGCDAYSHASAQNQRRILSCPISDGETTVTPSLLRWALRFDLLVRIPFRGKVARTISARHALLTD